MLYEFFLVSSWSANKQKIPGSVIYWVVHEKNIPKRQILYEYWFSCLYEASESVSKTID